MIRHAHRFAFCSLLFLAAALPTSGAEFLRDEVSLEQQVRDADHVVVATVSAVEARPGSTRAVWTLSVQQVLAGERELRDVRVACDHGTSLAPAARRVSGLFVLREGRDGDAAPLRLEHGFRSVVWLDGPAARHALNLAEVARSEDARLQARVLFSLAFSGTGWLADDALHSLAQRDLRPSASQAGQLADLLEFESERLADPALVFELLGRSAMPQHARALLAPLRSPGHFNAYAALADALRRCGPAALEELSGVVRSPLSATRARAARLLGRIGAVAPAATRAASAALLTRLSQDADSAVRAQAWLALGTSRAVGALAELKVACADEALGVRERKACALGLIALGRPGVQALRQLGSPLARVVLSDPVRERAALR